MLEDFYKMLAQKDYEFVARQIFRAMQEGYHELHVVVSATRCGFRPEIDDSRIFVSEATIKRLQNEGFEIKMPRYLDKGISDRPCTTQNCRTKICWK